MIVVYYSPFGEQDLGINHDWKIMITSEIWLTIDMIAFIKLYH